MKETYVAAVVIRLLVGPVREPATSREKAQSANRDSRNAVLDMFAVDEHQDKNLSSAVEAISALR